MTPLTPGMQHCPAHEDRAPSLSVRQAADGTWLLHCHGGCTPEAVLAAWGRTWADLFPDGAAPSQRPPALTETGRAIRALYQRADRAAIRRARFRHADREADDYRETLQVARDARRLGHDLGEAHPYTWPLLELAAELERLAWGAYGD